MKEPKKRFIIVCISFTLTILFYALIGELGIANKINNQTVYDFLLINFTISLVMLFTDRILTYTTIYAKIAVNIADIFLVVFLLGGILLKMFPLKLHLIVIISLIVFLVYFIIFAVMFIKDQADADCINKIIIAQKGGETNE